VESKVRVATIALPCAAFWAGVNGVVAENWGRRYPFRRGQGYWTAREIRTVSNPELLANSMVTPSTSARSPRNIRGWSGIIF